MCQLKMFLVVDDFMAEINKFNNFAKCFIANELSNAFVHIA